jgi:hypothetical protein
LLENTTERDSPFKYKNLVIKSYYLTLKLPIILALCRSFPCSDVAVFSHTPRLYFYPKATIAKFIRYTAWVCKKFLKPIWFPDTSPPFFCALSEHLGVRARPPPPSLHPKPSPSLILVLPFIYQDYLELRHKLVPGFAVEWVFRATYTAVMGTHSFIRYIVTLTVTSLVTTVTNKHLQ